MTESYIKDRSLATLRRRHIKSEKMLYLESVRGLAALSVLWAHILATYFPFITTGSEHGASKVHSLMVTLFSGFPFGFTNSGHFAVVLFFTLSGFVLTYKYFQTQDSFELQKQAAKRYFRLAIPVFFTVILSWLMMSTGALSNAATVATITGSPEAARIFEFAPTLWSALSDALFGTLVNGNANYNPVLWTMTIEFIGSFILFGLIVVIGNLKNRWLYYLASLIVLNYSYYTCFVLGAILADLLVNTKLIDQIREKVSPVYLYATLLATTLLASLPYPNPGYAEEKFRIIAFPTINFGQSFQVWHLTAATLLLGVILIRKEIQAILSTRLLVFIGGISFSLYLTHYLVLHSLGDTIFVALVNKLGVSYAALVAALVTVCVTVIVSVLWKKYIDDMSVRVSRSMARVLLRS